MSKRIEPIAVGVTSRNGNVIVAYHTSPECYFRPDTEELVFVASLESGEFGTYSRCLAFYMDKFHEANRNYSRALEAFGISIRESPFPHVRDQLYKDVQDAELDLQAKRDEIHKWIGSFSPSTMTYQPVVELIPLDGGSETKKQGLPLYQYAYVLASQFAELAKRGGIITIGLSQRKRVADSIYQKDAQGRIRIDEERLKQSLAALDVSALRAKFDSLTSWKGSTVDFQFLRTDTVLVNWARSWNEALDVNASLSESIDVSAAAQFMRFTSNLGTSSEYVPTTDKRLIKGEAMADFSVVSGAVDMTMYVPDRMGWRISLKNALNQTLDMGMLRMVLQPKLSGFVGASMMIEGQLQVVSNGERQVLVGQPGGKLPSFRNRRNRGVVVDEDAAQYNHTLMLSNELFAGGRLEVGLEGSLQWLKPDPVPDPELFSGTLTEDRSAGRFTNFCTVSSSIAGLTGIGAGRSFYCTFEQGKFRVYVAASLCWGVGAKGVLACEVNKSEILEFGEWLVYQLYILNFRYLTILSEDAFKAYWQYRIIQMSDAGINFYERLESGAAAFADVVNEFTKTIESLLDENEHGKSASANRNRLANTIVGDVKALLLMTPEGKGVLLFLLTRYGVWDFYDLGNRGVGLIPDIYHTRKEAVVKILKSVQTRSEWIAVLCCMTQDGSSMAAERDEAEIAFRQEILLEQFLQLGFNRHAEVFNRKSEISAIRDLIKVDANSGYVLSLNDSSYYALNTLDNPHLPNRAVFGPCNEPGYSTRSKS